MEEVYNWSSIPVFKIIFTSKPWNCYFFVSSEERKREKTVQNVVDYNSYYQFYKTKPYSVYIISK